MASWNDVFSRLGLSRVGDQVLTAARPSIRLSGTERVESADHRLGGRPNLPSGFHWPTHKEQPLAFLAQLDLAALPAVEGTDLPRTGVLHFFWGGMEMACGFSPNDRGAWHVAYSEPALADLPLRDLPDGLDDELRFDAIRLAVERTEPTFPGDEDMTIEALTLTPAEREGYKRFKAIWDQHRPAPTQSLSGYPSWCNTAKLKSHFDKNRPFGIHRVGGFPDYIQHDPKLQAHLVSHGLYCGDESGYSQGKEQGLFPGAVDWELLLQLDSEQAAEVSLGGDVGRVHFLIHKDDLRERHFEKAWLIFECY